MKYIHRQFKAIKFYILSFCCVNIAFAEEATDDTVLADTADTQEQATSSQRDLATPTLTYLNSIDSEEYPTKSIYTLQEITDSLEQGSFSLLKFYYDYSLNAYSFKGYNLDFLALGDAGGDTTYYYKWADSTVHNKGLTLVATTESADLSVSVNASDNERLNNSSSSTAIDVSHSFINVNPLSGSTNANVGDLTSNSQGGAIYNSKTISSITGDFIANNVITTSSYAEGGAIYNTGTIASIVGNFIGNYCMSTNYALAGAIHNAASKTITSITGDFIGNYVYSTGQGVAAGAIRNDGTITSIVGDFIGNYAYSKANFVYGGAFRNNTAGVVGSIIGDFIGNYAISDSTSGVVQGGAIFNANTISSVSGNFFGNYASSAGTNAFGGAVYNYAGKSITFDAEIQDVEFTGNYVIYYANSTKEQIVSNAIYQNGSNANTYLNAYGDYTITINDGIDGNTTSNNLYINSNSAASGTVYINNTLNNHQVMIVAGTLVLGEFSGIADDEGNYDIVSGYIDSSSAYVTNSTLTVSDGATLQTSLDYINFDSSDITNNGTLLLTGGEFTESISGSGHMEILEGVEMSSDINYISQDLTNYGTLSLSGEGTLSSTITNAENAFLSISAGSLAVENNGHIENDGTLELSSGTVNYAITGDGNIIIKSENTISTNGDLLGNSITNDGTLELSGGSLDYAVTGAGSIVILDNSDVSLNIDNIASTISVENNGTLYLSGETGSVINFELTGDGYINLSAELLGSITGDSVSGTVGIFEGTLSTSLSSYDDAGIDIEVIHFSDTSIVSSSANYIDAEIDVYGILEITGGDFTDDSQINIQAGGYLYISTELLDNDYIINDGTIGLIEGTLDTTFSSLSDVYGNVEIAKGEGDGKVSSILAYIDQDVVNNGTLILTDSGTLGQEISGAGTVEISEESTISSTASNLQNNITNYGDLTIEEDAVAVVVYSLSRSFVDDTAVDDTSVSYSIDNYGTLTINEDLATSTIYNYEDATLTIAADVKYAYIYNYEDATLTIDISSLDTGLITNYGLLYLDGTGTFSVTTSSLDNFQINEGASLSLASAYFDSAIANYGTLTLDSNITSIEHDITGDGDLYLGTYNVSVASSVSNDIYTVGYSGSYSSSNYGILLGSDAHITGAIYGDATADVSDIKISGYVAQTGDAVITVQDFDIIRIFDYSNISLGNYSVTNDTKFTNFYSSNSTFVLDNVSYTAGTSSSYYNPYYSSDFTGVIRLVGTSTGTISNSFFDDGYYSLSSAFFNVASTSTLTLTGTSVSSNTINIASSSATLFSSPSTLTLNNTYIDYNTLTVTSTGTINTIFSSPSSLVIKGGSISYNTIETPYAHYGMFRGSDIDVSDTKVVGNKISVTNSSYGIYGGFSHITSGQTATYDTVTFEDNTVSGSNLIRGTILHVHNTTFNEDTILTVKNSIFKNNSATSSAKNGVEGGAIGNFNATLYVEDTVFDSNNVNTTNTSGWAFGGAIYVGDEDYAAEVVTKLTNATFTNNFATSTRSSNSAGSIFGYSYKYGAWGGAIYLEDGVALTYEVEENEEIYNYGNYVSLNGTKTDSAGGFLYIEEGSTIAFDIDGTLIIGYATGSTTGYDSIASGSSSSTINKTGDGDMIVNSSMQYYTGYLYVQEGSMYYNNSDALDLNLLNISSGAFFQTSASNLTTATSSVTNYGTLSLTTGTLGRSISGTGTIVVYADNTVSSSAAYLGNAVVNSGTFTLTASSLSNAFTNTDTGILNTNATYLGSSSTITNAGIINLTGGTLTNTITGTIEDSKIVVASGDTVNSLATYLKDEVVNSGTFNLTDSSNFVDLGNTFTNNAGATLNADAYYVGGVVTEGETYADNNILNNGIFGLTGGSIGYALSTQAGSGTIQVNDGKTVTADADFIDSTIYNYGELALTTGTVAGDIIGEDADSVITVASGNKVSSNANYLQDEVSNSGTLTLTEGTLTNGFTNNSGAVLNTSASYLGETVTVDNDGSVYLSGSSADSTNLLSTEIVGDGTIYVTAQSEVSSNASYLGNEVSNSGEVTLTDGTLTSSFANTTTGVLNTNAAYLGTVTVENAGTVNLSGGELSAVIVGDSTTGNTSVINVEAASTVSSNASNLQDEVSNSGTLTLTDGTLTSDLTNNSILNTDASYLGEVTVTNAGTVNLSGSEDENTNTLSAGIENDGTIIISGEVDVKSTIDNNTSGEIIITADADVSINVLVLGSGTITVEEGGTLYMEGDNIGYNAVDNYGDFYLTEGTLTDTFTNYRSGTLYTNADYLGEAEADIINYGTISLWDGTISTDLSGVGGHIEVDEDATVDSVADNIDQKLDNNGTLDITGGTLDGEGLVVNDGTLNFATVDDEGNYVYYTSSDEGSLEIIGGTIVNNVDATINADASYVGGVVADGETYADNNIINNGTFGLTGGTLAYELSSQEGTGTIQVNEYATVTANADLIDSTIYNNGELALTTGTITGDIIGDSTEGNTSVITVASGEKIDSTANYLQDEVSNSGTFNLNGEMSSTNSLSNTFTNNLGATINADASFLSSDNNIDNNGTFGLTGGTIVNALSTQTSTNSTGTIQVNKDVTVTADADLIDATIYNLGELALSSGTVTGNIIGDSTDGNTSVITVASSEAVISNASNLQDEVVNSGTLTLTNGTLTSALTNTNTGTLYSDADYLGSVYIDNDGKVYLTGTGTLTADIDNTDGEIIITAYSDTTINMRIVGEGTITIQEDGSLTMIGDNIGDNLVSNFGDFYLTDGTLTKTFTNEDTGTLYTNANYLGDVKDVITNYGTISLNGGTISTEISGSGDIEVSAGATVNSTADNIDQSLTNYGTLNLTGGTLDGDGYIENNGTLNLAIGTVLDSDIDNEGLLNADASYVGGVVADGDTYADNNILNTGTFGLTGGTLAYALSSQEGTGTIQVNNAATVTANADLIDSTIYNLGTLVLTTGEITGDIIGKDDDSFVSVASTETVTSYAHYLQDEVVNDGTFHLEGISGEILEGGIDNSLTSTFSNNEALYLDASYVGGIVEDGADYADNNIINNGTLYLTGGTLSYALSSQEGTGSVEVISTADVYTSANNIDKVITNYGTLYITTGELGDYITYIEGKGLIVVEDDNYVNSLYASYLGNEVENYGEFTILEAKTEDNHLWNSFVNETDAILNIDASFVGDDLIYNYGTIGITGGTLENALTTQQGDGGIIRVNEDAEIVSADADLVDSTIYNYGTLSITSDGNDSDTITGNIIGSKEEGNTSLIMITYGYEVNSDASYLQDEVSNYGTLNISKGDTQALISNEFTGLLSLDASYVGDSNIDNNGTMGFTGGTIERALSEQYSSYGTGVYQVNEEATVDSIAANIDEGSTIYVVGDLVINGGELDGNIIGGESPATTVTMLRSFSFSAIADVEGNTTFSEDTSIGETASITNVNVTVDSGVTLTSMNDNSFDNTNIYNNGTIDAVAGTFGYSYMENNSSVVFYGGTLNSSISGSGSIYFKESVSSNSAISAGDISFYVSLVDSNIVNSSLTLSSSVESFSFDSISIKFDEDFLSTTNFSEDLIFIDATENSNLALNETAQAAEDAGNIDLGLISDMYEEGVNYNIINEGELWGVEFIGSIATCEPYYKTMAAAQAIGAAQEVGLDSLYRISQMRDFLNVLEQNTSEKIEHFSMVSVRNINFSSDTSSQGSIAGNRLYSSGALAHIDYIDNENWIISNALGGFYTKSSAKENGGSVETTSVVANTYTSYRFYKDFDFYLGLTFQVGSNNGERYAYTGTYKSDWKSITLSSFGGFRYLYQASENLSLKAVFGFDFAMYYADAHLETTEDLESMSFGEQTCYSLRPLAGGELSYYIPNWDLTTTLRGYYTYETLDDYYSVDVSHLNYDSSNDYTFDGLEVYKHKMIFGMGLSKVWKKDTIFYIDYNAHIYPTSKDLIHNINAGVKWIF